MLLATGWSHGTGKWHHDDMDREIRDFPVGAWRRQGAPFGTGLVGSSTGPMGDPPVTFRGLAPGHLPEVVRAIDRTP